MCIEKILNENEIIILQNCWKNSIDWEDIYPALWEKIYNYYVTNGIMPYGTAKARDGDPYNWITEQLEKDLEL